jgi:hypothetical protein
VEAAHAAVVVLAIARVGDAAPGVLAVVVTVLAAILALVAAIFAAIVAVLATILAPVMAVVSPRLDHGAPLQVLAAILQGHARLDRHGFTARLDGCGLAADLHGLATVATARLHGLAAVLAPRLHGIAAFGALLLALFLAMLLARMAVVLVLGRRRGRDPAGEQRGEGGGGKDSVADLADHGDSGCDARAGVFA